MITWTLHGPYSTLGWCIRRRGVSSRQLYLLTLNRAWTCRRRCWGTIVKIFNDWMYSEICETSSDYHLPESRKMFWKRLFSKNVSGKDAYFQVKSACFFISYRKIPLRLFNHTRLPTRRLSQSYRRFWATHVNRKWTVCIPLGIGFTQIFVQIVSIKWGGALCLGSGFRGHLVGIY